MPALFGREVVLNLGGLRIASRSVEGEPKPILRVIFKIERDQEKNANKATVSIWNLNQNSRKRLQEEGLRIEIEAGYINNTSRVFLGDLTYGAPEKSGTDRVSTFQCLDGGSAIRKARVNRSFGAGTTVKDVLLAAAREIGLGLGNVVTELGKGLPNSKAVQYVKGIVLSGQASEQFDKIVRRAGFKWSSQDGQIILSRGNNPTSSNRAVVLSRSTGLVGSPELGEGGNLKGNALLQAEILPGRQIKIQSGERNGSFEIDSFFTVKKTITTGDTWGTDWFSGFEARQFNG